MAEPQRILIVRPSALGDVCRTVPILATLRRAFPHAAIDWLVQSEFAPAIAAHPALRAPVLFPRREFGRWWRSPAAAAAVRRWFAGLRRNGYDLVFDCQGLGRSGLFAWMTRAPRRVGLRTAREFGWLGCNARHRPPAGCVHAVDLMMSLLVAEGLEPVYDMRLYAPPGDLAWWEEERPRLAGGGPYAVLAPTSRWESKRWPAAGWIELAPALRRRGFERVVLVGAPGERGQVEPIASAAEGAADLAGRLTLGQTMAVIAGSGLLVANDSAPLHMAVGFGRPCVGLFGPTDPARVGPYGGAESVVQAPRRGDFKDRRLGDAIMRLIDPQAVLDRIDAVLARDGSTPAPARPRRAQPAGEAVP
jgi:lipopolysaccharide heptosyltransferase I